MRRVVVLLLVFTVVAVPAAALAQQEPYSSSTTQVEPPTPTTSGSDNPEVPYTGFGLAPFAVAIAALVLFGSGALWYSRRARAKADD